LRTSLIDKAAHASRADLELLQAQSSLLITHAQIERMRLQLCGVTNKNPSRPVSYHGEDLLERMIKPKLNFLLPFKLHGQRVDKHRRSETQNMEAEVEKNEQNIETEFLRLFDYARCLSRICEVNDDAGEYQQINAPSNYRVSQLKNKESHNVAGAGERGHVLRNGIYRTPILTRDRSNVYNNRPISLVENPERRLNGTGNMRRFDEEATRKNEKRGEPASNPKSV
uniref:Uncharacterized protein n=1 Tax=Anisakis simplex TaxID=6269 RepID=A0A0M3J5T5_ANISI